MAVDVEGSGAPTGVVAGSAIGESVDTISAALAAGVVDAPTWQLSDEDVSDLVRALGGVRAGLDELTGRVVAEARRRDLPTRAGVASLSQWVQNRTTSPTPPTAAPPTSPTAAYSAPGTTTSSTKAHGQS